MFDDRIMRYSFGVLHLFDNQYIPVFLEEGDIPVNNGYEEVNTDDYVQVCKPMSRKKIAALREQKLTQKKMGEILRALAFFIFYISLLFLVSAGNRDRFAFSQYEQIKKLLADGGSPMNSNSTEMYPLSSVSTDANIQIL